jgi:hypothetical protein
VDNKQNPSPYLPEKNKKKYLELELIQARIPQKPLLWIEVGAHTVRKKSWRDEVVWAGAVVAWRLCFYCF